MKTKTKKTKKKSAAQSTSSTRSILGSNFIVWLSLIVVVSLAVSYQIVRANNNDGLSLNTPLGSIAREAQLDSIEQQQEFRNDQSFDQQQLLNAQGDGNGLRQFTEVINDAAR